MADPADASSRHASHQGEGRNVLRHHGASGDEAIFAERSAAYDGGVGSDCGAALHQGRPELVLALDLSARVHDVGKDTGGPAEDTILQGDAGVYANVVLDLAAIADRHVRADAYVLADDAVLSDAGVLEHVAEMPDPRALADLDAIVDGG